MFLPVTLFADPIPTPARGSVESWLWSATAVLCMYAIAKNAFTRKPPLQSEFASLTSFTEFRSEMKIGLKEANDQIKTGLEEANAQIIRFEQRISEKLDANKDAMTKTISAKNGEIFTLIRELDRKTERLDERTRGGSPAI